VSNLANRLADNIERAARARLAGDARVSDVPVKTLTKGAILDALASDAQPAISPGLKKGTIVNTQAIRADLAKHYAATGTGHPGGGDAAEPRGAGKIADRVVAMSRLHEATKAFEHAHDAYAKSLYGTNNKAERQRTSRAADRVAVALERAQADTRSRGVSDKTMQGIHERAMAEAKDEIYQKAERAGMQKGY